MATIASIQFRYGMYRLYYTYAVSHVLTINKKYTMIFVSMSNKIGQPVSVNGTLGRGIHETLMEMNRGNLCCDARGLWDGSLRNFELHLMLPQIEDNRAALVVNI